MKINLSYPATGCQKLIEIADELKVHSFTFLCLLFDPFKVTLKHASTNQVRPFYEKRMGQEVEADTLGDEFKVIIDLN